MCSVERAGRSGIAEDRWVFPVSGSDCHEHQFISNRWSFAETPAIELGGRLALEMAGLTIDDVDLVDLYSCFPSAVQLGAQEPRARSRPPAHPHRRPVVRRRAVEQLPDARHRHGDGRPARRQGHQRAGVGQRRLHHQARVRRLLARARRHSRSSTPTRRTRSTPCPAASWPRRTTPPGAATIEAYTVMHSRDGDPETADRQLPAGRRPPRLGHVERPGRSPRRCARASGSAERPSWRPTARSPRRKWAVPGS